MMTTMDDIPSHYINKAGIAKRLGISRVTVDRALTKISKDPTLSAILNVCIVSEGKRTLYFYEPSDVDSVFEQLQRSSRSRSKTVHSTNRSVTRKSTDQSFELLERDVQHLQKLLSKVENEVADLKEQRDKKDRQIEFLQTQITDQRSNVASTAPEPPKAAVVLPIMEPEQPKTATIAEIKEALADAGSIAVTPKEVSFVKDPVVANVTPSSFIDPKTEVDRDEDLDVTMSRLKYKIDRGEYKFTEAVYAQQISNLIDKKKDEVPEKVRERYVDGLMGLCEEVEMHFFTKFKVIEFLYPLPHGQHESYHKDLTNRLLSDIKSRASAEPPLVSFPKDLIKAIEEENDRLTKETANVVNLKVVKEEKALASAKQDDEDLDALLPDMMDHFNPMAEAEIALLDEKIADAKEAKEALANVETTEEQPEVEDAETIARRARIDEHLTARDEPKPPKKKGGLWGWLKY
jgi:prefoldin subunit 5